MNVIFLDFDGVIDTVHLNNNDDIEKKIKILAKACEKYDCKVVIEASMKDAMDEETMETESKWLKNILYLFKKYNIDCIGRTPNVIKRISKISYIPIWKEDEIRLYLFRHPEIQHYCIIDDDDLGPINSDLNKVKNHLVKTLYYSDNFEKEGLLESHIDEIGNVLKKDNEIRKLALKRKN